jgi:hypothetical protein
MRPSAGGDATQRRMSLLCRTSAGTRARRAPSGAVTAAPQSERRSSLAVVRFQSRAALTLFRTRPSAPLED